MEFLIIAGIVLFFLFMAVSQNLVQLTKSKVISLGGVVFNETTSVPGNIEITRQFTLPAQQAAGTPLPQPGIVESWSGNTSATIEMTNPAHGITTGVRVDVYWTALVNGVTVTYVQYGCTVGTVSGQLVPVTGGTATGIGTALPGVASQVTVAVSTSFAFAFDGYYAVTLLGNSVPLSGNPADTADVLLSFQTAGGTDEMSVLIPAGDVWEWNAGESPSLLSLASSGHLNITQVFVSHNSQSVGQTVQVGALTD